MREILATGLVFFAVSFVTLGLVGGLAILVALVWPPAGLILHALLLAIFWALAVGGIHLASLTFSAIYEKRLIPDYFGGYIGGFLGLLVGSPLFLGFFVGIQSCWARISVSTLTCRSNETIIAYAEAGLGLVIDGFSFGLLGAIGVIDGIDASSWWANAYLWGVRLSASLVAVGIIGTGLLSLLTILGLMKRNKAVHPTAREPVGARGG